MDQILPALAEQGVRIVPLDSLEAPQRGHLSRYFRSEVLPALTPLAIDVSRPFPRLANLTLNLAVLLAPAEGEEQPRLGVVQVPSGLRRLVRPIGGDGDTYVLLEEIIRAELAALFPGQTILESSLFRIVRDAEMELDDEGGRDYLQAIEEELRKRRSSRVVRLEVEAGVGDTLLGILVQRLTSRSRTSTSVRGPLDVRALQPLVELPALERLREPPLKPVHIVRRVRAPGRLRRAARARRPAAPSLRVLRSRWWPSSPRPRATPTCWPSSRRSTAPAGTARSCRRWRRPRRTASR